MFRNNVAQSKIKLVIIGVISCIILLLLDQFTKGLAVEYLKNKEPIVLIQNVFQLQYLENTGAAFGMFKNQLGFLIPLSILLSICFVFLYLKLPQTRRFIPLRVLLCFFLSGALGNMIDRLVYGYVIDFLYFKLIDFPIFNVADIYITCSCVVFAILLFAYYKDEDFDEIRLIKRKDN